MKCCISNHYNSRIAPFGNARYSKGTINTAKSFTGQYNDSLTGLDYYNARYYDPVAGVFLSADTVQGNGSGDNPYAYVNGNPETYSDPTGQLIVSSCYSQGCGISALPHPSLESLTSFPGLSTGATSTSASGPSPTSSSSGNNNNSSTCLVLGCRVTAHLDTSSSWVALQSQTQLLCSGGFGISCTLTGGGTTFYRQANPSIPISFCLQSAACLNDAYGNASEEESASNNDNIVFANEELGNPGADSQPQNASAGGTQEPGEAGTPTNTNVTRIGRWMSAEEYQAMLETGKVQQSTMGATYGAYTPEGYIQTAKPCSYYVEFGVPSTSFVETNQAKGWVKFLSPETIEGRFAALKGYPIPQLPDAQDIVFMAVRI